MTSRDWFSKDMVAVPVVDEQKVVVAETGRYRELAGEVGSDFAGDLFDSKEADVGFEVGVVRVREGIVIHEGVCV